MTPPRPGRVVCWGRGDRAYSRDAVLRTCFESLDFEVTDFRPRTGMSAGLEAVLALRGPVDLVWVPAFRHRDLAGAARWCRRRGVPLLFDPLISTYDKQVAERRKYAPESAFARRLLAWERSRMTLADVVLADTRAHARYFSDILGVPDERLHVVPVGVDETLFQPKPSSASDGPLELLFYGSFLALQGPRVIVDAARLGADQPLRWSLLGEGPLLAECREAARGLAGIRFEPWIDYSALPARVGEADVVLGIFGATDKAARVVPNKVHQALACARPVITLASDAYPPDLADSERSGLFWVPAADPAALLERAIALAARRGELPGLGQHARESYDRHYGAGALRSALRTALAALGLH